MLYATVNAPQAARAPDTPGVLGYLYNNGGLNNQKMALVSLLLMAIRDQRPVNLPYIYNKDQRISEEYLVRLEHVFDLNRIVTFAAKHGVQALSDCPSGERGGWTYFNLFQELISATPDPSALNTVLDAVGCLKPRITSRPEIVGLKNFIFGSMGIEMVVQLRIETDWRDHVLKNIHPLHGEHEGSGSGFMEILTKVKNTFPDLRMIYATSDENAMPASRDEIRSLCRTRLGIDLIWKTDLLPAPFLAQLTPLDLSLIDFEIAKSSRRFVGLTTSTFANMLGLEKLAQTRKPVRGHYIYNTSQDVVVERKDSGFVVGKGGFLQPPRAEELLAGSAAA